MSQTLDQRIRHAENTFQDTTGIQQLTSPRSTKKLNVKTNKQLVKFIQLEITKQLELIRFAVAQYGALQKMWATKGKEDKLVYIVNDKVQRVVTKEDLSVYRESINIALKNVARALPALHKRYRHPLDPALAAVSGANALTYVDNPMARYLTGSDLSEAGARSVLTDPIATIRSAANAVAGKLKVKDIDLSREQLLANLNAALSGQDEGSSLGIILSKTLSKVPAYVARLILVTMPHLIRYYREKALGQAASVVISKRWQFTDRATGKVKFVRPYYLVTSEFDPIRATIEGLAVNRDTGTVNTEETAKLNASMSDGKKVPGVIRHGGQYYYSLTAVQQWNSYHVAKKSPVGPGEAITVGIMKEDRAAWPAMWAAINGKTGSPDVLNEAREVLAIFKAIYNVFRSK